jgi:hypothetical protein
MEAEEEKTKSGVDDRARPRTSGLVQLDFYADVCLVAHNFG